MDLEFLKVVAEGLEYLSTQWNQDIDDVSLRIASPTLRSLLVEGQLSKAAHVMEAEIQIMAPLICGRQKFENLGDITFYQCGGAKYKGNIIQSLSLMNRCLSRQEVAERYKAEKGVIGKSCPVKLSTFLKQISFVIEGVTVNREEVIKYVANKLGGAHYDSARKASDDTSKITLEDKYALMDKVRDSLTTADKNAIYYELLSIGQRVVNSRDVQKLRKKLKLTITGSKNSLPIIAVKTQPQKRPVSSKRIK